VERSASRNAVSIRQQLPTVHLVVSFKGDDRFLVEMTSTGPRWVQVELPVDVRGVGRFGPRIEAAVRATLGMDVSYVGLLAFEVSSKSYEMHALVLAHDATNAAFATQGLAALTLQQLTGHGADPTLIRHCQDASHRTRAEEFAATVGERVQQALMKSVQHIEDNYTDQDDLSGWSQYWEERSVGILSTAQGLLALVHAGARSRFIQAAAATLEQTQNEDGGWAIRHSLIGEPSSVSITESTCYCMWALMEADRTVSGEAISLGAVWLLGTQRPSGGWAASEYSDDTEVIATAFAVRILSGLGYAQAAARGVEWLRSGQRADGGWGYLHSGDSHIGRRSLAAPTAHAIITLLANGASREDEAIVRAIAYLQREFDLLAAEPWPSTVFATSVDPEGKSGLAFQNFALPWVLVALGMAGFDLSEPMMQVSIASLLRFQDLDGAWWCWQSDRRLRTVWSTHDAVFALRSVINIGSSNLAPMAMRRHSDATIALMENVVEQLLPKAVAPRPSGTAVVVCLRVALLTALLLGIAVQVSDLLGVAKVLSPVGSAITLVVTTIVGIAVAAAPAILAEEYRRRRASPAPATGKAERRKSPR
jgi:hypothetical protein